MNDKPDIVYGRLLESAHISGYGFERMVDELEWLLEGKRWQSVGTGYKDINEFLRSIDVSAFNLTDRPKLQKRIKELQPDASIRAIVKATGGSYGAAHEAINGRDRKRSLHDDRAASDQDERNAGDRTRSPFERDSAGVAELARQASRRAEAAADREQKREANRALALGVEPPRGQARTIVIDPPWDWGDEGDVDQFGRAAPVYATQTIEEIAEMPLGVQALADAHLYLWITNRSLPKGFALLDEWGFRYVTCLTWVKPSFGMGNYYRGQTEHVLFGVRGSLPLLRADVGTVIAAPRGDQHSAKPEEFYDLVETCSPGPWMDIYARRERPGWLTWGAEV